MADVHRGSNYMTRTRVNGFQLIEDVEIKEVSHSFQSLLYNLGDQGPSINGTSFDSLWIEDSRGYSCLFMIRGGCLLSLYPSCLGINLLCCKIDFTKGQLCINKNSQHANLFMSQFEIPRKVSRDLGTFKEIFFGKEEPLRKSFT